jgi:hypothetical protein
MYVKPFTNYLMYVETLYPIHVALAEMSVPVKRVKHLLRTPFWGFLVRAVSSIPPSSLSHAAPPSFSELYGLPPIVVKNMEKHGLVHPTEIQKKVGGRYYVIDKTWPGHYKSSCTEFWGFHTEAWNSPHPMLFQYHQPSWLWADYLSPWLIYHLG